MVDVDEVGHKGHIMENVRLLYIVMLRRILKGLSAIPTTSITRI